MCNRSQVSKSLPAVLVAAFLAAACSSTSSDSAPITADAVEIKASDALTFSSPHITVAPGTTVRWRNVGSHAHTVTSGLSSKAADQPGAEFDAQLPGGATFEFTFDEVGDHPYFCRLHEAMGMKGVITVAPTGADGGTAASSDIVDPADAGTGYGNGYGY